MSWNTDTRENLTHGLKQRAHAKKRLRERYGIRINRRDYRLVCAAVRRSKRIVENHEERKVCIILWNNRLMLAVYDRVTREIATFLPLFSPLKEKP